MTVMTTFNNDKNDQSNNTPPQNPWGRSSKKPEGGSPWGSGPWDKKPKGANQSGGSMDDDIERIKNAFKKGMGGGNGGGSDEFKLTPKKIIMGVALLAVALGSSGFFRVQEGDLGVVLRFGEVNRIVSAGLHYHLPGPFESVTVQKVSAVNTIDGGMKGSDADPTLILTGDENMVHTNYTVLWKIKDVTDYLFTARKPENTIQVAAESVIREIIGQTHARAALTEGRDRIGQQAQELLQKLLDGYRLGIQIISVQLQSVAPPREVIDSFNDVQSSLVDADQEVNKAESYRNDIIPRARGQAIQMIQDSEAYRATQIAAAEGEASRFLQVYTSFERNPLVAKMTMYFKTMQSVIKGAIVLDPKVSNSMLPHLPIANLAAAKPAVDSNNRNDHHEKN